MEVKVTIILESSKDPNINPSKVILIPKGNAYKAIPGRINGWKAMIKMVKGKRTKIRMNACLKDMLDK
jgi:hypothetical protein